MENFQNVYVSIIHTTLLHLNTHVIHCLCINQGFINTQDALFLVITSKKLKINDPITYCYPSRMLPLTALFDGVSNVCRILD